jgi:hypothetical protein
MPASRVAIIAVAVLDTSTSGTQAGTYAITATARSGSTTQAAVYNLTVD